MKLILLLIVLLIPLGVSAQTTHQVCNSGCQYSSVQAAYDAAKYGDTIVLAAGQNFDFRTPLNISAKGAPPTNTERDYITITTSDPAGIPTALSKYPRELVRPTTAMAARMPKMRTLSAEPVLNIMRGAKWIRFEGTEFTAVDTGVSVIRLVQGDLNGEVRADSELPERISFRRCWFHPPQETGAPMSAANIDRTVENAIYLDANNVELLENAFTGFAGKYKYRETGKILTSSNLLLTVGRNWIVRGNFFGAWTYAILSGGSTMPRWTVTKSATVSNCQGNPTTQCDFSNTTGLSVGDPVAVFVSTSTSDNKWGASFVATISGSTVKFTKPLCQSFDGSNTCTDQNGTPANGDRAQWDGIQPTNYLFERNAFVHDDEWRSLLGECGGKGYDEMKSGVGFTFRGNLYQGCSGHAITVRNQGADFVWASVSNLVREFNFYRNSNNTMVAFCQDVIPTKRSSGLVWRHNLQVGLERNVNIPGGMLASSFKGCENVTIEHNTVAWIPGNHNFANHAPSFGVTIKDNIFPIGQNGCFRGDTTLPMADCWPNANIRNNYFINLGATDYEREWWLGAWPNQTILRSWAQVGFVNPTQFLDANGDYRLRADSTLIGKASDGTNPGADVEAVMRTVFGSEPLPSPTPLPSVSPTPIPSPTAQPTPSPLPTPVASPVPTPTPQPPPGQIILSGRTFSALDGGPFPWTVVVLSDSNGNEIRRLQEQDNSYSFVVAPGSYQIHIEQSGGFNVSPGRIYVSNATESTGGLAILNFTLGPDSWFKTGAAHCMPGGGQCPPGQPLPSPTATPTPTSTPTPTPTPTATPTPLPSPSPSPTPVPSPTPQPSPTPLPFCVSGQRPGNPPVCRCRNGFQGNSGKCR